MLNTRLAILITLSALLAACSSQPEKNQQTNETYIQAGALSTIAPLITNQRFNEAENSLNAIDIYALTDLEQVEYYWLTAQLSVALGRGDAALTALNAVPPGAFAQLNHIPTHAPGFLRASALHLKAQYIASARERMFLSGVLEDEMYLQNHQAIWASLMLADETELTELSTKTSTPMFKGWLELALIVKQTQLDIDRQLSALRKWQVKYNNHPAAKELPGDLAQLEDYVQSKAKNIALMLPLSGKLATTGKALRDGLMAAYYQALQAGASVPEIKIYDTATTNDFWALYKQAIFDGNELVIGPLNKSNVERLQQESRLPVPTLALNYGVRDAQENPEQLFQFGLAVEDEAELAALYARQQGYQNAVALMPKGAWGERVFKRFSETWSAQGGQLVEAQFFTGKGDYNKVISRLFAVDDSERRARELRKQLGTPLESQARRRNDVDFIFVAALPQQARQIKPTLAFNFAKDIPMVATSQIYSGQIERSKDRDLDNVVFCDIPWVLEKNSLRKKIQKTWSQSNNNLDRLYALGVDAYQLYPRLGQIKIFKNSRIQGQTGALAMDSAGQIVRNLPFATFKNGVATKIQEPINLNPISHVQAN